jgi:hypothetical protein
LPGGWQEGVVMARKKGTVFKTVEYHRNQQDVKVPIRVVAKDNTSSWQDQSIAVTYSVEIDEPCKISVSGKTPDEVRDAAFAELDNFFAITWSEFYMVHVEHNVGIEHCDASLLGGGQISIEYSPVSVGVTKAGKKVYRTGDDGYIQNGEVEVGYEEGDRYGRNCMTALVPATPENKAALDSIIATLHALAKRVEKLMAPKEIQKTLLNSAKLLMPPEAGK